MTFLLFEIFYFFAKFHQKKFLCLENKVCSGMHPDVRVTGRKRIEAIIQPELSTETTFSLAPSPHQFYHNRPPCPQNA